MYVHFENVNDEGRNLTHIKESGCRIQENIGNLVNPCRPYLKNRNRWRTAEIIQDPKLKFFLV